MNIVEVGTGTGVFSNWFLSSHKMEFKYYAIDPLAENLEKIKNDKRVVKINCAIGKRNEERLFYVNSNTDLSSFYPNQNLISKNLNSRIHVDDQFKKLEFTKVRTLTNILLESKLNTIHFLKLDTQGLDLEIILSLRKIVKKIKFICCELPYDYSMYTNYKKSPTLIDSLIRIKKIGFNVVQIVSNNNQECNVFLVNKEISYDEYFKFERKFNLKNAPCLKLGPHIDPSITHFIRFKTFSKRLVGSFFL